MILLDGKKLAEEKNQLLKNQITKLKEKNNAQITLACVLVGEDESSKIYVNHKIKTCKKVGITPEFIHVDSQITQTKLNNLLKKLSSDNSINGILLQLPLPAHINPRQAISHIAPEKDVDGLTSLNLGKLMAGEYSGLTACTAVGIIELLNEYNITLSGKNVCIIGKSLIVGKPLLELLLNQEATVSICHRKTKDLIKYTKTADIIVSATGKRGLITKKHIKRGATLIDVGIIRENNKIYGDIDFDSVKKKAKYITPVPGGIGPLTVAMLMQNTLNAYLQQQKNSIKA